MEKTIYKCRKKAEIIQKGASLLPKYNKMIPTILEENNLKYGEKDANILDVFYKDSKDLSIIVIYIHGGGWCSYDKDFYRPVCRKFANMNLVVFNCNYGLAPTYKVKDMEEDIFKVLDYVKENAIKYNGDTSKIILVGDSAGAHLISLVTNKLCLDKYADNSYKKNIIALGLFYGVYDLYGSLSCKFKNIRIFINSIVDINSSRKLMDEISPINYVSNKLPPVFIASGEIDKLHLESKKYYHKLIENDVLVKKVFFSLKTMSARHSFLNYIDSKACRESLREFHEFIDNLV